METKSNEKKANDVKMERSGRYCQHESTKSLSKLAVKLIGSDLRPVKEPTQLETVTAVDTVPVKGRKDPTWQSRSHRHSCWITSLAVNMGKGNL